MIGTQITIENNRNGKSFIINDYSDPDNIIALQSFPTDNVDVRVNDIPNSGSHGSHKLPYYYGGRSIILNGVIAANDEATVWAMKKQIDDTLQFENIPDYEEDLSLTFTDPLGVSKTIQCSMSIATNYNRNLMQRFILQFQITLRSNQYYYLVNEDPLEFDGLLGYEFGGFKLSTLVPFQLLTSFSEVQTVTVEGNYFTKLRLYGSDDGVVTNPRFKNTTTGEDIIFYYTLDGADEYIEIDGFTGNIVNQDGQDLTVFLVSGDFLTLVDGNNTLAYLSTLSPGQIPPTAVYTIEAKQYEI